MTSRPFRYIELPLQLAQAAIDLREFGVHEVAWARSDAMAVLEYLGSAGVPVLGGDVLTSVRPVAYAYANWHADPLPGEDVPTYAVRSQRATRDFIERYPGDAAWFVLVLGKPASSSTRSPNEG